LLEDYYSYHKTLHGNYEFSKLLDLLSTKKIILIFFYLGYITELSTLVESMELRFIVLGRAKLTSQSMLIP
jgi:hypothetical protein